MPDRLYCVAGDVNMEWIFATTFENQEMAVMRNLQLVVAVAVFEQQAMERAARRERVAVFHFVLPVGEGEHCGVAGGGEIFFVE